MYRSRNHIARRLTLHVRRLRACRSCPRMQPPVVSGEVVVSPVMLVGQAPGDKEPVLGRPFAWTAGKTLFRWFNAACRISEAEFRQHVYMAAVCRCFPGKNPGGGDRVPAEDEIANCAVWLEKEMAILQPQLVIAVGKLAISRFMPVIKLDQIIGRQFRSRYAGHDFDLIPLPHPSGASPWHRVEPGKQLLATALAEIRRHPAFQQIVGARPEGSTELQVPFRP